MREILFRGKRVEDGNWLYGYYSDEKAEDTDFPCIVPFETVPDYNWEVVPETVGQYTGLTDKNGKKIFEGDIVKISNDEIFEVKYEDGGFTAGLFLGDWDYGHVEVIGNIYDNPELIGGEAHG